jgi:hypothetical protein
MRVHAILCLAALFALSIPTSYATGKDEQGYVIEQNCLSMGNQRIVLTPTAIKIDNRKGTGNVLVSEAPTWKVLIFNTKSKRIMSAEADKFTGGSTPFVVIGLGISFYKLPLQPQKETTEKGLVLRNYVMPRRPVPQLDDRKKAFNQLQGIIGASYSVTNSIHVPKQIQKILVKYYGLPDKDGIPITVNYDDAEGMHFNWLFTQSLKTGSINPSEFAVPKNYQVVKAQIDLMCPPSSSQVRDIFDLTRARDEK